MPSAEIVASEGRSMKIYLLFLLMSALMVAIRLTAAPKTSAETLPQ